MNDRTLVAALVAGEPRGLESAYRRHADGLYSYCLGQLRDSEAATDVVHDTFVLASQRAYRLREPERLGVWLYAIARDGCRQVLGDRAKHGWSPPPPAGDPATAAPEADPETHRDPVTNLPMAEIQELVWSAAESLDPGDWDVFELTVRHGLPAQDVEELLEVPSTEVHTRLSRGRSQLERALRTLPVARAGTGDCPELADLLPGWDGRLVAPVERRIHRHIEACDTCTARRDRTRRPSLLIPSYATSRYLPVPPVLWSRLELKCFDPAFAPERAAIVERANRFDRKTGFPRPLARRQRRLAAAGTAAVVVGVLMVGAAVTLSGSDGDQPAPPAAAAAAPSPTAPASIAPAGGPRTAGPRHSPRASAGPAPSAPAPADPAPPAQVVVPPAGAAEGVTVAASAEVGCVAGGLLGYSLAVDASASRPLDAAVLFVTADSELRSFEMAVAGSNASAETDLMAEPELEWSVQVTGDNGETAATAPAQVSRPCG